MKDHGTPLTVELPGTPVSVFGDAARLRQIQANLLSNATRHSAPGAEVRLSMQVDGDQAEVTAADRGRGIEPALLPRIFDLFVQGPQTLARSDGGLCKGLTLLRSLVGQTICNTRLTSRASSSGRTGFARNPSAPTSAAFRRCSS